MSLSAQLGRRWVPGFCWVLIIYHAVLYVCGVTKHLGACDKNVGAQFDAHPFVNGF